MTAEQQAKLFQDFTQADSLTALVPEVVLQRPCVVAIVGQLESAVLFEVGAHALCPRGRGDCSDSNFHPAPIPGNLV